MACGRVRTPDTSRAGEKNTASFSCTIFRTSRKFPQKWSGTHQTNLHYYFHKCWCLFKNVFCSLKGILLIINFDKLDLDSGWFVQNRFAYPIQKRSVSYYAKLQFGAFGRNSDKQNRQSINGDLGKYLYVVVLQELSPSCSYRWSMASRTVNFYGVSQHNFTLTPSSPQLLTARWPQTVERGDNLTPVAVALFEVMGGCGEGGWGWDGHRISQELTQRQP